MSVSIMMSYAVGPSLEEACRMENCCVCGKLKERPNKPTCLACFAFSRPDRPSFGDMWKDGMSQEQINAAWNGWICGVIAAQN